MEHPVQSISVICAKLPTVLHSTYTVFIYSSCLQYTATCVCIITMAQQVDNSSCFIYIYIYQSDFSYIFLNITLCLPLFVLFFFFSLLPLFTNVKLLDT